MTLLVPSDAIEPTNYELDIKPFYTDEDNLTHLEAVGYYSEIVNWVTLSENDRAGKLYPGESKIIPFTIDVPKDAPAGGQYFTILITVYDSKESGALNETHSMTHLIYAEVAGETRRQGEITSLTVPSFLLSGKITGTAAIKNLGNVHSNAKHILRIYPLFSDEELYTNEEDPYENLIMPEVTRQSSVSWNETPSVGIFRVKYTVEFEGVKNELEKIVIICPLWLLIIIFLFIVVLIYRIVTGAKKKPAAKPAEA